tara:strand:+ start:451 stop:651 length:201 start_codon:yes stop_codon:yes gene_type:complete
MIFPAETTLQDALLWEEGVCLDCGLPSEPLDDLTRLHSCEECGGVWCVPAVMLVKIKDAVEETRTE